jgi:flagellar hook-basal body complex protein FliE
MTIDAIGSVSKFGSLIGSGAKHSSGAPSATIEDFASVMADLAKQTASNLKASEDTAIKGVQGQAPLQDVVQSVMRAQTSLQTALALRDKAVSAYQDLTRMSI